MAPAVARAALESLLRTRKLDTTLTTALPSAGPDRADRAVPIGHEAWTDRSAAAWRAGSSPRSSDSAPRDARRCVHALLADTTARGELVAFIDTLDRFDLASAVTAGVVLEQLLWVRGEGGRTRSCRSTRRGNRRGPAAAARRRSARRLRALKATRARALAGGFGVVVLDLADVPRRVLGALPFTTWLRLQRLIAVERHGVRADRRFAAGAKHRRRIRADRARSISVAAGARPRSSARFRDQVLASRRPFVVLAWQRCPAASRSVSTGDQPGSVARRFRGLAVEAHVQSGLRTVGLPAGSGTTTGRAWFVCLRLTGWAATVDVARAALLDVAQQFRRA